MYQSLASLSLLEKAHPITHPLPLGGFSQWEAPAGDWREGGVGGLPSISSLPQRGLGDDGPFVPSQEHLKRH